jgi:hypothetical protein
MTMIVIPPVEITDALLVSSTAYEVAPAAYNAGTTYASGAFVSVAGSAGLITVYKSLQNSNTGHTPASSPSWWLEHCTTYQEYSGAATYALDDYVINATTHRTYKSLANSNTGNALTDTTKWFLVGATNKWAMFDFDRSVGTSQTGPLTVTFTPGQRITAIALLGIVGASVTVTMTVAAVTVYTATRSLSGRDTRTWSDYFFGTFGQIPSLLLSDLPAYSGATVTVTLVGTVVSCGACVVGSAVTIGQILQGAKSDGLNFSRFDRDDFGNSVLVPRRTVPRTSQTILFEKVNTNRIRDLRSSLNAKTAVWIGLSDQSNDYFETLLILGIYKQFEISLDHPTHAVLNLELEEM